MKNIFTKFAAVALIAFASTLSAKADAVFILDTFNSSSSFGLVSQSGTPVGSSFMGQIYGSFTSSDPQTFVALGSAETFSVGYLYNPNPVNVVGANAGQTLNYKLVAWNSAAGSTFEQAVSNSGIVGSSGVATLTLASSLNAFDQQNANTFTSFSVAAVPEPTTIALGVLGGLGMLARRRRNAV
jgi:hypothetical protein